jgi:phosphatidylglycerol:prolipoprotein diacylglycerol transferase
MASLPLASLPGLSSPGLLFTSPGEMLPGPIPLRWYGLLIAVAVLVGLRLSTQLGRERGLDPAVIADLLPIMVLAAVLGARTYYVIFEWRQFAPHPIQALYIWQGGIAIHGALIGGTIATVLYCRLRKLPFWTLVDVLVPSVALGQAIGRWGNFFNSEAFGLPTDLPWKLTILDSARIPLRYQGYSTFHPTFLYESLWNLGVCALLLVLFRLVSRGRIRLPSGGLSCIYLMAYSSGRVWIEALRLDPLCLFSAPPDCAGGLRMAQLISLVLIALGAFGLWWRWRVAGADPELSAPNSRRHDGVQA